jgi:hypothetical protein
MPVQTQFSTDPNAIVTVNVSIVEAPTPINYQRTGAFVSFGATTLTAGDTELLTQWSDLVAPPESNPSGPPILPSPLAITSATWAAGIVTVTTAAAIPNVTIGDNPDYVLAGFSPTGYNGFVEATITAANTFTYSLAANPGAVVTQGTYISADSIELSQMATTFFGQGNAIGVWILELGYQSVVPGNEVTALENWLKQNPKTIYGFLMPRRFGSDPTYLGTAEAPSAFTSLLKQYENPEAMEYFWLTVTSTTMTNLFFPGQLGSGGTKGTGSSFKDVIQMVEAPILTDLASVPPNSTTGYSNLLDQEGEFTIAALFYNALAYRPSNTNRISPMAFKFLYGVTEYPQKNNGPLLLSFKSANTNYVTTGAEGGISFTMVYEGVTLDGHDYFNWWYTIDWVQINVNLDLSNAIINGSNNPLAPLYYNQDGINTLETVLFNTMQDAQTFGMVLGKITMTQYDGPDLTAAIAGGQFAGQCDVNAVPFLNYTLANPGDYKIGEYDGLSALFIPARGFIHILVNIVATDLISI